MVKPTPPTFTGVLNTPFTGTIFPLAFLNAALITFLFQPISLIKYLAILEAEDCLRKYDFT